MADNASPMCEVHGGPLTVQDVRIQYGLIRRSPKVTLTYLDARRRYFPHCDDVVLGGCRVREQRTRSKQVCPVCCEARNAWLQQHYTTWIDTHNPSGL